MFYEIAHPFPNFSGATVQNLIYLAIDYLFMLGLKLNYASKKKQMTQIWIQINKGNQPTLAGVREIVYAYVCGIQNGPSFVQTITCQIPALIIT